MRSNQVRLKLLAIMIGCACALLTVCERQVFAQKNDPLVDDRPVQITRKKKTNRKPVRRAKVVEKVPLLKLEWRGYKGRDEWSQEETNPLAGFYKSHPPPGFVAPKQDGYLLHAHSR